MADLLTPVSQTYTNATPNADLVERPEAAQAKVHTPVEFGGRSPEDALQALKSQPSYDTLLSVLTFLRKGTRGKHPFNISTPGSLSAQITQVLIVEIVPNYWPVLQESPGHQQELISCLQSLTGINAVLTHLRALIRQNQLEPKTSKDSHLIFNLTFALDLLGRLLEGHEQLRRLWAPISSLDNALQRRAMRQELVTLLSSGKIVTLSAEAVHICQQADKLDEPLWIGDGKQYTEWLGHNLVTGIKSDANDEDLKLYADVFVRATRLGHSEWLTRTLFTDILLSEPSGQTTIQKFISYFPPSERRRILLSILKLLATKYLNSLDNIHAAGHYPLIWAAAGALSAIVATDEGMKSALVDWLTNASGAGVGDECGIRRAVIAVLAEDKEAVATVLEKSLLQFGDQLYIKHAPILQQEAHAQVLLLSAGYTHRLAPIKLTVLLRSSPYLHTISNRLSSSQTRTRFLGMVVGEALSGLVHNKETKLDFKMDETDTEEASWYKSLVQVSDKVGPLDPLRVTSTPLQPRRASGAKKPKMEPRMGLPRLPSTSGFIIEEVEDEEETEDPDLVPYAKPDSDAEDSDDDPTLINRNKPKAPVYIRDLIAYLRDTESYDKQKLALTTAPTLIRRKANYGTEVISHAEELATLLVGLQDKFDLDNFDSLRQQGMIALVASQPKKMGQWFSKTFFDGDYSLSQRAMILIVLGLSGREIAGFETSEYAATSQFPSKTLPAKVEKYYKPSASSAQLRSPGSDLKALPPNALDSLAQSLSQTFLAPMAAEAADAATGPDALKLSSFTSRLKEQGPKSVSKAKSKNQRTGVRAIPNQTAAVISTSFFFPLTSRFQAVLHSASATTRGIIFQPYLLTLYLKTLALLLHAAGPSTLALPQMTSEYWDLLLGVRAQCIGDLGVTQAVLFGLMALLDVNENDMRGLCERHGREVVETTDWVSSVFEKTRGGDGEHGEENDVKMLAAGVLIRLREAVDRHQAVLMGDLIGFSS
ncbi:telomere length regulation protein-domain-containing protein [Xylariomycetidae sp. FL2044]|nr:telomere length regulation protein-domain-containing protein [Xylariomycetidae sp. FL2044]